MKENSLENKSVEKKFNTELVDLDWSLYELDNIESRDEAYYKDAIVWKKEDDLRAIKERIAEERFWNMLITNINEANFEMPQDRNVKIIDLACGVCEEKNVVNAYFGGGNNPYLLNKNVELFGIDNDVEAVRLANEKVLPDYRDNYKFVNGDATNLDKYPEIPGSADVVIMRHQQMFQPNYNKNYVVETELWKNIFEQGLKRLNDKGVYLVTSYTSDEHKRFLEFLTEEDCQIINTGDNEFAEPLGAGGIDKYVIVLKKVINQNYEK